MKRITSYTGASGDVRTRVDIGAVRYGRRRNSRLLAALLVIAVAVVMLVVIAATAHGQTNIGEPWCQVSAPQPQGVQMRCLEPRVHLPIVETK